MIKIFANKQVWMKVHLYLSLFFLPAAFIYALTGSLYLFGIREESGATIHEFAIQSVPKGQEKEIIINTLVENNLRIPDNTELRMFRGNQNMGGLSYNVSLIKDKENGYKIRVVERGLYGILLLMHKSKGKFYFDIIAVSFSISLLIFYFSGLVITSFCKKKRGVALSAFGLGFIITAVMIYLSI